MFWRLFVKIPKVHFCLFGLWATLGRIYCRLCAQVSLLAELQVLSALPRVKSFLTECKTSTVQTALSL